jgi:hypothetical protein
MNSEWSQDAGIVLLGIGIIIALAFAWSAVKDWRKTK